MITLQIQEKISKPDFLSPAVRFFWDTRDIQKEKQKEKGGKDQGERSGATGGKQMDGFVDSIVGLLKEIDVPPQDIFTNSKIEIPGFFRAEKRWDLLIIKKNFNEDKKLVAAMELKSHPGPSFGNNVNNRAEEAIGSAIDVWKAYRDGIFKSSPAPWLGYFLLVEDCEKSRQPVVIREPHFKVFPEFKGASYCERYHQLCIRLVRERCYNSSSLILADKEKRNQNNNYSELYPELTVSQFLTSLLFHASSYYVQDSPQD